MDEPSTSFNKPHRPNRLHHQSSLKKNYLATSPADKSPKSPIFFSPKLRRRSKSLWALGGDSRRRSSVTIDNYNKVKINV